MSVSAYNEYANINYNGIPCNFYCVYVISKNAWKNTEAVCRQYVRIVLWKLGYSGKQSGSQHKSRVHEQIHQTRVYRLCMQGEALTSK